MAYFPDSEMMMMMMEERGVDGWDQNWYWTLAERMLSGFNWLRIGAGGGLL
jgi:hypothetical protein